jgi:hypothetical protein
MNAWISWKAQRGDDDQQHQYRTEGDDQSGADPDLAHLVCLRFSAAQ